MNWIYNSIIDNTDHSVINDEGNEIELHSSVECKGIIGNDGRHYVLDLLRTFPPDINFLPGFLFYSILLVIYLLLFTFIIYFHYFVFTFIRCWWGIIRENEISWFSQISLSQTCLFKKGAVGFLYWVSNGLNISGLSLLS